ncbi:hypothetical protein CAL7102_06410 [Dulcicalothrix desertica PCC 7102]|nr:hypothetical protein CAL7102_06410 [Dulcicalothrix desertica PCC 7102]
MRMNLKILSSNFKSRRRFGSSSCLPGSCLLNFCYFKFFLTKNEYTYLLIGFMNLPTPHHSSYEYKFFDQIFKKYGAFVNFVVLMF